MYVFSRFYMGYSHDFCFRGRTIVERLGSIKTSSTSSVWQFAIAAKRGLQTRPATDASRVGIPQASAG